MKSEEIKPGVFFSANIKALAHGGSGVAEIMASQEKPEFLGKTAFIPQTIPGEVVTARLETDFKNYAEASLVSIQSTSPHRVEAPCPYFGSCGGCNFQHITLDAQRQFKLEMVKGYLAKHSGLIDDSVVSLYGESLPGFAYRKRVIFHLNRAGEIGFYHQKTKRIIKIENCLIALPEINFALKKLSQYMSEFAGAVDDIVVEYLPVESSEPRTIFSENPNQDPNLYIELKLRPKLKNGKENEFAEILGALLSPVFYNLTVSFCAIPLFVSKADKKINPEEQELPVGHFSQVNEEGNSLLQELVTKYSEGSSEITELFAGAGNFTFPLARKAKKVIAVEANRALVAYGIKQAESLGLSGKVEFVRKSCEKYVRKNKLLDCLVIDPPRSGAEEVARTVNIEDTSKIVYVSCALPTLCRDIKILLEKGYVLKETKVIDMFPQTHHVETVSLLSK